MNYIKSPVAVLRRQGGYKSQREAALALGVGTVHLSNVERGAVRPSPALMKRMSEMYGCVADRLRSAVGRARHAYLERMLEGGK